MVATITTVPLRLVLSVAHLLHKMPPMISVLKVGDYQPIVNKTALLVLLMSQFFTLYIVGFTIVAQFSILKLVATGGLLLRTTITTRTVWATLVVYILVMVPNIMDSPYGVYGLARAP